MFVVPVVFHPVPRLKLFAGPGFESKPEEWERKTVFLFRVGAGYSIELGGRYSITPTLELDFLAEEDGRARAFVYGASFGVGF